MIDWPVKTLGEVCDFVRGVTYDKADARSEMKDGFIPLLRATNITENGILNEGHVFVPKKGVRADQKLMSGDALITIASGSASVVGRSVLVEDPGEITFGAFCGVLRPGSEILPRYLSHFLSSRTVRTAWSEAAQGTNINNLKRDDILQTECLVPPLDEQKRIVALLDDATARITELTACYERARAHANNFFTSALRDALESNPDWPVRALGDLLDVSIGGIWGSEAGKDDIDVFVYRSTELNKDGQLKGDLTVRRSITMKQLQSRKLEEGDLLLEKSGGGPKTPVGRVGLVKVLSGLSVCSNFMQLMRPRRNEVLPVYLHYFLNYFHIAGYTEDLQNNSTNIRNLKTTEYMQVEIPLPPLDEQKWIVARLDQMRAKTAEMVAAYDAKLQAANNLRQSILETAFAGEL
jgi:type I restriction enzyme S subunit